MPNNATDQCAAKVLETCHLLLRTVGMEMNKRSPLALSIRQIMAMMAIRDQHGASLSDISEHIGGTISTASKLMDALVERGFVARSTAEGDRRKLVLALTDKGQEAIATIGIEEMSFLKGKLSAFTPSECSMVNLVMDLLRRALSADRVEPAEKSTKKEVSSV